MGECSEALNKIYDSLATGIVLKDDSGHTITIPTEETIQDIRDQTDQFTFETYNEKDYLLVRTNMEVSDLEIGGVELKDGSSDVRATIEADSGKNALYVKSQSLLTKTEFTNQIGNYGDGDTPTAYTINWRLLQIADNLETIDGVLDNIDTQLDKMTYDSTALLVKDSRFTFDTGVLLTEDSRFAFESNDLKVKDSQLKFDGDYLKVIQEEITPTINTIIDTTSISYSNEDPENTLKLVTDLEVPTNIKEVYSVSIENPSTETDLEVQLYVKEVFGTDTRWAKLGDQFTVEKSPDYTNPDQTDKVNVSFEQVRGAYLAHGLGISMWNTTEIGVSGAFTSRIIVREAKNDS